ncbi:hypothetical protein [Spiroplasma turonicum]|uniref:Lipoprotein n=1 Tax=Spiroplasma turonicum TaxID=216946 RepID=A0A0K1P6I6_9MOLU|nr:hypothetical protein [Spiroplasma turonicum]AKU79895.1 hypothetical protein STURON_00649 [Spiroplasma turonicum]ALX70906.1 hypothetical protein STURO_v1c06470 [Spiroplasma turonicum]
MKKLMSITSLLGISVYSISTTFTVTSCSTNGEEKKQATELTYVDGKTDSEFVNLLKNDNNLQLSNGGDTNTYRNFKLSEDNKGLGDDYGDTKNNLFEFKLGDLFSLEGTAMSKFDNQAPFFEQTKDLKEVDGNDEHLNGWNTFTIKGNKGDTEFKLNCFYIKVNINYDEQKMDLLSVDHLFYKTIKIS